MSINLKAREGVLGAIRQHGPFKSISLQAYLIPRFTLAEISTALAELVFLERVTISKERQLTAV